MNQVPEFAPFLTIDYLKTADENKLFDRKGKNVKPSALAELISAFANADGGTIVIGANDNKEFEGIDTLSAERYNQLINAPKDYCRPTPAFSYEEKPIINNKGPEDHLLLLHIERESERIIQTQNESVYLRIGDRTREVKGEDLRQLEYSKGLRRYEDECNQDATIYDLDDELLDLYKKKLSASHLTNESVLAARGFIKYRNGEKLLTNAAVLLFARHIMQFFPHCRVRVTRYQGNQKESGLGLNIVKDVNFDAPIPRLLEKVKDFISASLREFTTLNPNSSLFETAPEYPEFAWTELLVNALTHREYAMEGTYVQINLFDNRMEVISPGSLPGIVTTENITYTRNSRNSRISRALSDLGWVRELNEGVPRIYSEMRKSMLSDPEYTEPDNRYVKAILKNNIEIRTLRSKLCATHAVAPHVWEKLDDLEKEILVILVECSNASIKELVEKTHRSAPTVKKRLKNLLTEQLITCKAASNFDPGKRYSIILPE